MRDPAETKKTNNKNHRQYISIFHLIKLKFIFFIPYYIKLYQLQTPQTGKYFGCPGNLF